MTNCGVNSSAMRPFDEAFELWIREIHPVEAVECPATAVAGRVLAADVTADVDLPPFDTSAMDGWAVDRGTIGELPVSGRIAAAPGLPPPLASGTAAKVMTGAPIPAGTFGIVPVEEADDLGDRVRFRRAAGEGDHVRRAGEIFRRGAPIAAAGELVTPRRAALLVAAARGPFSVRRSPRVAILVTGDELVPPGEETGPGQIRNSNGTFLAAAAAAAGADVVAIATAPDEPKPLAAALRKLLGTIPAPDLVFTSGGVSMGDRDHVAASVAGAGFELLFHKVDIRPAKPVLAARRGSLHLLGLPGNPVSVAVAFALFGAPALRLLSGRPVLPWPTAELEVPVTNRGPRRAFLDAMAWVEAGRLLVRPLRTKGSHDLATHAAADVLVALPPASQFDAGDRVAVVPLDGSLLAG